MEFPKEFKTFVTVTSGVLTTLFVSLPMIMDLDLKNPAFKDQINKCFESNKVRVRLVPYAATASWAMVPPLAVAGGAYGCISFFSNPEKYKYQVAGACGASIILTTIYKIKRGIK